MTSKIIYILDGMQGRCKK